MEDMSWYEDRPEVEEEIPGHLIRNPVGEVQIGRRIYYIFLPFIAWSQPRMIKRLCVYTGGRSVEPLDAVAGASVTVIGKVVDPPMGTGDKELWFRKIIVSRAAIIARD